MGESEASLHIKEDSTESLDKIAVSLLQQMFHDPAYCVKVKLDDSPGAQNMLRRMMVANPVPVCEHSSLGFILGLLISEKSTAIVSTIHSSQHFQRLLVLVTGPLQTILDVPLTFANISSDVVAANCCAMFRLTSPQNQHFQHINGPINVEQGRLPDMQGRTLRVATLHCPPFSYRNNWENLIHDGSIPLGIPDGVEMAVFLALSKRLNFTWKLQEFHNTDMWGHRSGNGTWSGGIMGAMSQKSADIAFCGIFIGDATMKAMDLTIPWTHYCLTFLVPRKPLSFHFAFLRTFQPLLWFAITLVTLGTTLIYWLLSHCKQKPHSLAEALLIAVGLLSLSSFPEQKSHAGTLRPLIVSWSVFSLLMTTALSSGLVSHLTRPSATAQLNTVRDLVEAGITWGQTYRQEHLGLFNPEDHWHVKFADRFVLEPNQYARVTRIRKGNYAVLGGKLDGTAPYFMEGDTLKDTGLLPHLHVMDECLARQYAALGLIKGSSLTEPVSRMLSWLLETGLVQHWQADLVRDHGNPEIKLLFQTAHQTGPQQLTWTHLEDVFLLLCTGLVAAAVMFVMEICHSKFSRVSHSNTDSVVFIG